jgi:hypothetical protein
MLTSQCYCENKLSEASHLFSMLRDSGVVDELNDLLHLNHLEVFGA